LFGVPHAGHEVFQQNSAAVVDFRASRAEVLAARLARAERFIKLVEAKYRDPGLDIFSELAVKRLRTGELTKGADR
jgi:hypothetical protein